MASKNIKKMIQEKLAPLVVSERDSLNSMLSTCGILHHYPQRISGFVGIVEGAGSEPDDANLVERLVSSYSKASSTRLDPQGPFWSDYSANYNKETHATLVEGDLKAVTYMLRNPAASMLFYGFDSLSSADAPRTQMASWRHWLHMLSYDSLLRLAEIVGTIRMQYSEAPLADLKAAGPPDVESLLLGLDSVFGFHIDFPNLFPGEIGLATSRGVASYRAIQALYQAYIVNKMSGDNRAAHVLEIGAGLGRTAYYSAKFGFSKYTIVDLPLTNVAQGYFLGRTLGQQRVQLFGEAGEEKYKFRIIPPDSFFLDKENYDLVINIDSLTEMSEETANKYFDEICQRSPRFLSVNHEHNNFTCRDIYMAHQQATQKFVRRPYPMRRGYVEEVIDFV
jgi:hypothetical protein